MKFIGVLFVFLGYVLVYASVAAGGTFATDPLAGLFADAYTDVNIDAGAGGTGGTIGPSPTTRRGMGSTATTTGGSATGTPFGGFR